MLAALGGKLLAGSVVREKNRFPFVVGTKTVRLFEGL